MTSKCKNPNCFVDEGVSCSEGHMNYEECPQYTSDKIKESEHDVVSSHSGARVPWSGSALGLSDLLILCSRGQPVLIGILGSHDSGKTTLLLGNYLSLVQGASIAKARFSGSWTLGAWESLASWPRFSSLNSSPQFPPHTPRSADRAPGLLHFSLRKPDDSFKDILLTDAPGEWFSNWSIEENSNSSAGARWTVENSDAFLILADCERLSGESRGRARNELRQLFERLGAYVQNRPVTLVWAKSDVIPVKDLSQKLVESIRRSLLDNIPHATEQFSTIKEPTTFIKALETVIDPAWSPVEVPHIKEPIISTNPFAAYRGHHGDT